jgi:hypothetical protein
MDGSRGIRRRSADGHHVEGALGALALAQDLAWHDHLERLPARRAAHESQGDAGGGGNGFGPARGPGEW